MVQNECGVVAANISAYMFHSHASYFTKYTVCNFTSEQVYGKGEAEQLTECWYDWLLQRIAQTSAAPPTTVQLDLTTVSTTVSSMIITPTQSAAESNSDYTWSHSPKRPHTSSYVTVRSKNSGSEESTEWNKASSSMVSTDYEEVEKKENKAESSYKYEDNSIHEEKHEEHGEDEEDSDDGGHGGEEEKVVDTSSESYKEKKKSHKHLHHHKSDNGQRTPVHGYGTSLPTVDSIMPELFQNDADLKTNATGAGPQASSKSAVVARESKALTSNSQPESPADNSASSTFFSSLVSLVISFLLFSLVTL